MNALIAALEAKLEVLKEKAQAGAVVAEEDVNDAIEVIETRLNELLAKL